jgi:hypothetical protein
MDDTQKITHSFIHCKGLYAFRKTKLDILSFISLQFLMY